MAEYIRSGELTAEEAANLIDTKAFNKEQVDTFKLAAALGWGLVVTSDQSITLVPFGEKPGQRGKRIHLSARHPVPVRKMIRQLRRFADPAKVAILDAAADRISNAESVTEALKAVEDWDTTVDSIQDPHAIVQVMTPEVEKPKEARMKKVPTPAQVEEKVQQERHVVTERPTLMHQTIGSDGVGRSYPSQTTLERHWSDGVVEYVCACCGKTSENRRAFGGAHWAKHVRQGDAQPVEDRRKHTVEDPSYTDHAWSRNADLKNKRSAALAEMLKGIDLTKISPEDLAEQIMAFLGDTGGGGGISEPLTDTQILDRIRSLVDRGVYADQEQAIRDRDQQIEDLMAYAEKQEEDLREELLLAQQETVKAKSTISAFFSLMEEIKDEHGESA